MKVYPTISIIVILLFLSSVSAAQNSFRDSLRIDSLKKVLPLQKEDTSKINSYNKLCGLLSEYNDCKESIEYANKSLALSKKLNFTKGIATAYYNIAFNYSILGNNFPQAMEAINAAIKIREGLADKKGIAECFQVISTINYNLGNYPEGLKYMYDALKIYEDMGEHKLIINSLLNIASVNTSQGNDSEALRNDLAALKLSQETKDKNNIAISCIGLADNYNKLGMYAEALSKANEAMTIFRQTNNGNSIWAIPYLYTIIGQAFAKQGEAAEAKGAKDSASAKFAGALNSGFSALRLYEGSNEKNGVALSELNIGKLYLRLRNLKASREYLQKSLQLSKALDMRSTVSDNYEALSTLESLLGNYKQAYENYKIHIAYRDSLNNEKTAGLSVKYKMQYEFDKKESIGKAAQDKKDADAKRIKNQQYFTIAGLAVVVLAVMIIAFIQFRNNKQKKKANFLLIAQKQKVESTLSELKSTQAQLIQSEKMASLGELTAGIAHEIQNPLNFVNNFSEVNNEMVDEATEEIKKGNYDEVKNILNDIKDNSQKINHHGKRADAIVKGMLQHSRLSTGVKEPTDINALADEYLKLAYHGLRAKDKDFNATIKTDFDPSTGRVNIIPQDIGRVLLNLYNNAFYAVKQAKDPLVTVTTKKTGDKVEIKVADNGSGIPQNIIDKIFQPFYTTKPTGQGTGLGLSLSYDIIKALGGEIKVESTEGKGTEFIIYF